MSSTEEINYTLVSNDNLKLKISNSALKHSKTLLDAVHTINDVNSEIPLAQISGETLKLIVEWCEKHKNEVARYSEVKPKEVKVPEWDEQWLQQMENSNLFDVICGSNYLNIQVLMDYACKAVVNLIGDKSPAQIRTVFGILTDEEEEELELNQPGPSNR